jgi:hypothetical protein
MWILGVVTINAHIDQGGAMLLFLPNRFSGIKCNWMFPIQQQDVAAEGAVNAHLPSMIAYADTEEDLVLAAYTSSGCNGLKRVP